MGSKIERAPAHGGRGRARSCRARPSVIRDAAKVVELGDRYGWPIAIKASAGGGGRGHEGRRARPDEAEPRARDRAAPGRGLLRRRAPSTSRSTSRTRVTSRSRCWPTATARSIHLGERDCTLQRRHQKVLEESPSPAVDAGAARAHGRRWRSPRRAPSATSARARSSACSTAMATFFFLEMNTRIQVEHPVTELVTGLRPRARADRDRRRRCAARAAQEDVELRGHAFECRINAEDAGAGFRPAPGRITRYREPCGPGRARRLGHRGGRRGRRPLRPDDRQAAASGTADRARASPAHAARARRVRGRGRADAAAAAPADLRRTRRSSRVRPAPGLIEGELADALAPAAPAEAALPPAERAHDRRSRSTARRYEVRVLEPAGRRRSRPSAGAATSAARAGAAAGAGGEAITSPMQGTVLRVEVAEGEAVESGRVLVIVEAMKMENEIAADRPGVVADLRVAPGDCRPLRPGAAVGGRRRVRRRLTLRSPRSRRRLRRRARPPTPRARWSCSCAAAPSARARRSRALRGRRRPPEHAAARDAPGPRRASRPSSARPRARSAAAVPGRRRDGPPALHARRARRVRPGRRACSASRACAGVRAGVPLGVVPRARPIACRRSSTRRRSGARRRRSRTAAAGEGMRIGIIDDGIDITPPVLLGRRLQLSAGLPEGAEERASNGKIIVARAFAPPGSGPRDAHGLRPGRLRARHARRRHRRRHLGHHGDGRRRPRAQPLGRRAATPTSATTACSPRRRRTFGLDGNGAEIARAIDQRRGRRHGRAQPLARRARGRARRRPRRAAIHGAARAGRRRPSSPRATRATRAASARSPRRAAPPTRSRSPRSRTTASSACPLAVDRARRHRRSRAVAGARRDPGELEGRRAAACRRPAAAAAARARSCSCSSARRAPPRRPTRRSPARRAGLVLVHARRGRPAHGRCGGLDAGGTARRRDLAPHGAGAREQLGARPAASSRSRSTTSTQSLGSGNGGLIDLVLVARPGADSLRAQARRRGARRGHRLADPGRLRHLGRHEHGVARRSPAPRRCCASATRTGRPRRSSRRSC